MFLISIKRPQVAYAGTSYQLRRATQVLTGIFTIAISGASTQSQAEYMNEMMSEGRSKNETM